MQLLVTISILTALLTGCSRAQEPADEPPAASPSTVTTPVTATPDAVAEPRHADAGRGTENLVTGCPGMLPKRRARGSNCFGISPQQCGANIAARHVGEQMTETLAFRMEEIARGGARIIHPKEVVHDDLRDSRLNVVLDAQNRIAEVDCY